MTPKHVGDVFVGVMNFFKIGYRGEILETVYTHSRNEWKLWVRTVNPRHI